MTNLFSLIVFLHLLFSTSICFSQNQFIELCKEDRIYTYYANGNETSTYEWDVSGGVSFNQTGGVIEVVWPDANNRYVIRVIETNNFGCRGNEKKMIVIIQGCLYYYIPNTFTPNEDTYNDNFGIVGKNFNFQYFRLEIFNRIGQQLFYTENPYVLWDGYYFGRPVQEDVYVFKVSFLQKNTKDGVKEFFGPVNLIR